MPLYEFLCKNAKCKETKFEVLCSFNERNQVRCPQCKSHNVTPEITTPAVHFDNPQGTSKSDNFEYMAEYNLEKGKSLRRKAEAKSHMGADPYKEQEKIDLGQHDLNQYEGKIV